MEVLKHIAYREGKPDDYPQIVGLLAVTGLLDARRDTLAIYSSMLSARPGSIQVAEHVPERHIIGTCLSDMPHPIVGSLGVHPDFQRNGIGTALLERMVAYLRSEGHSYAELLISPTDKRLLKFYKRRGFKETDKCLLMERQIAPEGPPVYYGANIDSMTASQAFDVIFNAPSLHIAPVDLPVRSILQLMGAAMGDDYEKAAMNVLARPAIAPWESEDSSHWGRVLLDRQAERPKMIHSVWKEAIPPHYGTTIIKKTDDTLTAVKGTKSGKEFVDTFYLGGLTALLREDAQILLRLQGVQNASTLALSRYTP